uniref:UL4 family protein n=1 Tax=Anatid alphaherpesvirus 2 TaxID=3080522 RepID=A0AAU0K746_9ALPH
MSSTAGQIATFITYTLIGAKASPTWAVPNYEQIICSCDGGTRSVAVGGMSRCDYLPATNMILQRGPAGTLLILDGGVEFCSYLLRSDDSPTARTCSSLSSTPGSLCVVPFSSCTVIGLDTYACNHSSGVLTVTWLRQAAYITLTVYGRASRANDTEPGALCTLEGRTRPGDPASGGSPRSGNCDESAVGGDAGVTLAATCEEGVAAEEMSSGADNGDAVVARSAAVHQNLEGETDGDLLTEALREAHLGVDHMRFDDVIGCLDGVLTSVQTSDQAVPDLSVIPYAIPYDGDAETAAVVGGSQGDDFNFLDV